MNFDKHLAAAREKAKRDPRTDSELIATARAERDSNTSWDAIRILQYRGTRSIFRLAVRLAKSKNPADRCLSANVLAQLGIPRRLARRKQAGVLIRMLKRERSARVLKSIGIALSHLNDTRAIRPLSHLMKHQDAGVRYGVVFGLLTLDRAEAIHVLIALSSDRDPDVRNWATFGLGSQIDRDTPGIRAALAARVADRCREARYEAIVGLAKRKDARTVDLILSELRARRPDEMIFRAAEEFGDPVFLNALERHRHIKNPSLRFIAPKLTSY